MRENEREGESVDLLSELFNLTTYSWLLESGCFFSEGSLLLGPLYKGLECKWFSGSSGVINPEMKSFLQ